MKIKGRHLRKRWLLVGFAALVIGINALDTSSVSWGGPALAQEAPGPIHVAPAPAPRWFPDFELRREFPHDPGAFTQGLFFHEGFLFEGTGLYGRSSLRRVDLETGRALEQVDLEPRLFGEGTAVLDGLIYQLTWRSRRGFVYSASDLELLGEFSYETEGWGLTSDGEQLIMSDGTSLLYFVDPHSFEVVRTLEVIGDEGPVWHLNELEFVEGAILANVWMRDVILQISPETGAVTGEYDMAGLVAYERPEGFGSVLNGIAYDTVAKRLFVTGKLWSHVYEISLRRPAHRPGRR